MADHTRASDSERERVALQLASAASDGRLTVEELEERTGAALAASTRGELAALLDDLPDARLPAQRRRRLPWLPGRMPFSARWRGPKNPQRAGNDMLELLVPVFARDGYVLVDRSGDRLVLERESRPGWTILVAIAVFPIGLHRPRTQEPRPRHDRHDRARRSHGRGRPGRRPAGDQAWAS